METPVDVVAACVALDCACMQALVPESHASVAATSSLCKLLTWHLDGHLERHAAAGATPQLLHQADWLASLLTGALAVHACMHCSTRACAGSPARVCDPKSQLGAMHA